MIPSEVTYTAAPYPNQCRLERTLKEYIAFEAKQHGIDPKTALAVSYCESRYYENATGTQAAVGKDIGMFQINTYYHESKAQKMDLNIYEPRDNIEYAMWLMERQGLQPWSASKSCWINRI